MPALARDRPGTSRSLAGSTRAAVGHPLPQPSRPPVQRQASEMYGMPVRDTTRAERPPRTSALISTPPCVAGGSHGIWGPGRCRRGRARHRLLLGWLMTQPFSRCGWVPCQVRARCRAAPSTRPRERWGCLLRSQGVLTPPSCPLSTLDIWMTWPRRCRRGVFWELDPNHAAGEEVGDPALKGAWILDLAEWGKLREDRLRGRRAIKTRYVL